MVSHAEMQMIDGGEFRTKNIALEHRNPCFGLFFGMGRKGGDTFAALVKQEVCGALFSRKYEEF